MKRLIISCFLFLASITFSFGQKAELKFGTFESSEKDKFIIIIKNHEIMFEDSLQNGFQNINHSWIKSIEILRNYESPRKPITNRGNKTIIIKLKNRKWKKLPIELQKQFNLENKD